MSRTLLAALACRVQGSRLYGKPLQNLRADYTILDHILTCIAHTPEIDQAILGISEGVENLPFVDVAKRHGAGYIVGDQKDVLRRLIQCGRAGATSDVFRITTECPFIAWEMVGDAWREHVARNNEITVLDGVCEGCGFEIYRLDALERAWNSAAAEERSEYANAYPRRHQDQFRIGIIDAPPPLDRMDVRLTVDYPEDLVLCRHIFRDLEDRGPLIPLADIVAYCDAHPALYDLVKPFNVPGRVWKGAATGIGLRSVVQERH